MRNILTVILLFLLSFSALSVNDNDNMLGWKTYLSYNNTNCVEESADQVFVIAEGALYIYGKEDNSIKQYYKGNGLSDTDIQSISYNKQTKSLLIVYKKLQYRHSGRRFSKKHTLSVHDNFFKR